VTVHSKLEHVGFICRLPSTETPLSISTLTTYIKPTNF
jgi:hypothetical protein